MSHVLKSAAKLTWRAIPPTTFSEFDQNSHGPWILIQIYVVINNWSEQFFLIKEYKIYFWLQKNLFKAIISLKIVLRLDKT